MESNLNLYNKYRPSTFEEVVGQDHVVKLLNRQIQNKSLPHFIIMYGPPGTGKTTAARIIATMLNKSPHGTVEIDSAIDGGKDNIRTLQLDVFNRPLEGEFKTYIFDEAHEITRQGFASLLKLTEEPPSHVKFIFITNNFESIPLNIRSRAQCHQFTRIPSKIIEDRVRYISKQEKQVLPDELISLVVEAGAGSLRNAIVALESIIVSYLSGQTSGEMADILGIIGSKRLSDWIMSYLVGNLKEVCNGVKIFSPDKTDTLKAISELQQFTTDARMCLAMPDMITEVKSDVSILLNKIENSLVNPDIKTKKNYLFGIGRLLDALYDTSLSIESSAKYTTNKEALLNRFAIKLGRIWNDKESLYSQKSG